MNLRALLALLAVLAFGQTATAQVSRPGQTFPGLANYSIGGAHNYDNAAVIAHAALDDVYIVATYNGWQSGHSLTMPGVEAAIAAQTTRGTKVISYFDPIYTANALPAFLAQMNSANFWLRTTQPSGSIQQFGGANAAGVYPGGPTGVGGRNYIQFDADYNIDWMFNGGAAGLATNAVDAVNSALSGVYEDDLQTNRPTVADWARTGGSNTGTDAQMRTAFLAILQRMRADKPGILLFANIAGAQNPNNTWAPEYTAAFDGGVLENMVGSTNSIENIGGNSSLAVLAYQNQMTLLNQNKLGIFSAPITRDGRDAIDTTVPYQAFRHAFAMCLVVGNALCAITSSGSNYDPEADAAMWFDEESVNRTTSNPYTTPNSSAALGLGYLGTAVDPPQTAPYQNGYWRRRFQYGEVWWSPREASAGTINFGGTVNFINGRQAPTFNTGGSGSTHPISSRDGIVVLYQNTPAQAAASTSAASPVPEPPTGVSITK